MGKCVLSLLGTRLGTYIFFNYLIIDKQGLGIKALKI